MLVAAAIAGMSFGSAYVLVTFTPAELEYPGIVSDEGDTYRSVSYRKLLRGFLAHTFGRVAWLRAKVTSLDPDNLSERISHTLSHRLYLIIAVLGESCGWRKTPVHGPPVSSNSRCR